MRMPCVMCVLLVAGCFSVASFANSGEEDRRKAAKDFYEHNYQKALAEYQQAIPLDEENHRKLHQDESTARTFGATYLAITYARLGDFDKALESWKTHFGTQPLPPDAPEVDGRITDAEIRYLVQRMTMMISGTRSHPKTLTYHFDWPYYYGIADMMRHAGLTDSADKVENEGRIFLEATVAGYKAAASGASAARVRVYEAENRPQYAEDERQSEAEVRQSEAEYQAAYQAEHPPSTLDMIIAGLSGANVSSAASAPGSAPGNSTGTTASNQASTQSDTGITNGGVDVQACLARKDALRVSSSQTYSQYQACDKAEWDKEHAYERSHLGTNQPYCQTSLTGAGHKLESRCGTVQYDCPVCRDLAVQAKCAAVEAEGLECQSTGSVH